MLIILAKGVWNCRPIAQSPSSTTPATHPNGSLNQTTLINYAKINNTTKCTSHATWIDRGLNTMIFPLGSLKTFFFSCAWPGNCTAAMIIVDLNILGARLHLITNEKRRYTILKSFFHFFFFFFSSLSQSGSLINRLYERSRWYLFFPLPPTLRTINKWITIKLR